MINNIIFDLGNVLMNFKPLQKSVWVGPSPVVAEFIKLLKELSILIFIKLFKVLNKDII